VKIHGQSGEKELFDAFLCFLCEIFTTPFFSPQSLGLNIEELFEDASDASRNYPNGTIFLKML
jgi:hypothetical protein